MQVIPTAQNGVVYHRCDGFPAHIAHGFSTRIGGVSTGALASMNLAATRGDDPICVGENFARFCGAIGSDAGALVKNHQVHGTDIRSVTAEDIITPPEAPGLFPADGLVTDQVGLCLTIFSADCIPLLLCDPEQGVVAAAHAGWRGAVHGIGARAVEAMVSRYGCDPQNILAAIGPGISQCCFETRSDVADALRQKLGSDAESHVKISSQEQFHIDLKGVNAHWLRQAGLSPQHIACSPACTACDLESFWSHRVQGLNRGSMAAMIQLL